MTSYHVFTRLSILFMMMYMETGKYMSYCCSWTPEISQSGVQETVHKQGMVKTGSIITWMVQ